MTPEQLVDNLITSGGISRPDLHGYSNLSGIPEEPPVTNHYSLEATQGRRVPVEVNGITIGGPELVLMAGPCSIDERHYIAAARAAKAAGASILRGGAFKPRTSPYSYQGLGERGLKMQRQIADELGMLVVTEATGERNLLVVTVNADIIQIGARNSQNFELLTAAGLLAREYNRVVLYKRGPAMTIHEFLCGAEYILATGCMKVVLCERGSVTNSGITLDEDGIRELMQRTHLPVIADPTHAAQTAEEVPTLARKAIELGVDGLIVEVHPCPGEAKSDGHRALLPAQLRSVADMMQQLAPAGRYFQAPM